MKAPQIILIVLWSMSFALSLKDHGNERKGKENVITSLINIAIVAGLLWWGGFWG